MTDDLFAPSPELQAEIDEALDDLRKGRKNEGWTSKKGVLLNQKVTYKPIVAPAMSYSSVQAAQMMQVHTGNYMAAVLHTLAGT